MGMCGVHIAYFVFEYALNSNCINYVNVNGNTNQKKISKYID